MLSLALEKEVIGINQSNYIQELNLAALRDTYEKIFGADFITAKHLSNFADYRKLMETEPGTRAYRRKKRLIDSTTTMCITISGHWLNLATQTSEFAVYNAFSVAVTPTRENPFKRAHSRIQTPEGDRIIPVDGWPRNRSIPTWGLDDYGIIATDYGFFSASPSNLGVANGPDRLETVLWSEDLDGLLTQIQDIEGGIVPNSKYLSSIEPQLIPSIRLHEQRDIFHYSRVVYSREEKDWRVSPAKDIVSFF